MRIDIDYQAGNAWTPQERLVATASIVMVLEALGGPEVQVVHVIPTREEIPGFGIPKGHLDPDSGLITLNASHLVGLQAPSPGSTPLSTRERLARILLTSAHEAVHASQRHRGHVLPSDEEAIATYDSDPWYEVEAREISMEVLKGRWPKLDPEFTLVLGGRAYQPPAQTRFENAWARLERGGAWWQEQEVPVIHRANRSPR